MNPAAVLNVVVQTKGVGAAQAQLQRLDRSARKAGDGLDHAGRRSRAASRAFSQLGTAAKVGAGAAVVGMGMLAKSSVDAASDLNESLSKNRVLFGKHAGVIESFAKDAAESWGLSQRAAAEAAGGFGSFFKAAGKGQKDAAQMSATMTKIAVDLASFNNTSVADALQALSSGLAGESEPLRRYQVLLNDATLRQQALKSGMIQTTKEALTPQQKTLATYQLILAKTGQQQGDFARTSGGLAGQQKILGAQWDNLKVKLGTELIPVMTKALQATTSFVAGFENGTGAGGRFRDQMGRIWEQLRPVLASTLEVAKAVGAFAAKNPGIVKVAASFAAVGLAIKGIKFASKITGLSTFLSAARTGASTFQAIWARAGTRAGAAAAANSADELARRSPASLAARTGRVKDALYAFGKTVGPSLGAGIAAAALRELGNMLDNALGVSKQARSKANAFSPNNALDAIKNLLDPGAFLKKAGGGWIGAPGEAGRDQVPVMLGRGEAVLNRHQQGPVESALRSTFGFGLDGLFARERRPHYMAAGGRAGSARRGVVTGDTDYLPSMRRALEAMSAATGVPIFVQSGRRTLAEQAALYNRYKGKRPVAAPTVNAPHVRGVAADISPGRERFGRIAGRYGLAFTVPEEPWHIALSGAGAVAGTTLTGSMRTKVAELAYKGFLGAALPGAVRAGARPFLARIRGVAGMARGGRVGQSGLVNLWERAGGSSRAAATAAAVALAESGGNPRASNRNTDGSIDRGLWQINSVHGALSTFDQLGNARAAVRISKGGRDWSPWVAYKNGRWRRFLKPTATTRRATRKTLAHTVKQTGKAGFGHSGMNTWAGFPRDVGNTPAARSFLKIPETSTAGGYDLAGGMASAAAQGIPMVDTSTPAGMSQQDRDEVLKGILAELKVQNARAERVGSTSGGVLARAVADVASGQIAGQVIRGAQTPMWPGSGARY